jgi:hypothetical protein
MWDLQTRPGYRTQDEWPEVPANDLIGHQKSRHFPRYYSFPVQFMSYQLLITRTAHALRDACKHKIVYHLLFIFVKKGFRLF